MKNKKEEEEEEVECVKKYEFKCIAEAENSVSL